MHRKLAIARLFRDPNYLLTFREMSHQTTMMAKTTSINVAVKLVYFVYKNRH